MKRVLPAITLIAALSMAGCSGGGSGSGDGAEGSDSGSQQEAEKTPEVTQLNEDQLKKILESTDVDGTAFKPLDTSEVKGSDAAKALEDAEYDPPKCKDLAMAALNASEVTGATMVAGMTSDSKLTAALMSFKDVAAAEDQMKTSDHITKECNDVQVKIQGVEMTMKYETSEATVAGADDTLGTSMTVETAGASAFKSDSVIARVGNHIVNSASMDQDASEDTPTKASEEFVKALADAS